MELINKIGHLSQTRKMPCPSWSLSAFDCTSKDEICKKICYAKNGHYNFKVVQNAVSKNKMIYFNDNWIDSMVMYVKDVKDLDFFRWFDGGDIPSIILFEKICQIADKCPNTKFWLPTRQKEILLAYFEANGDKKLKDLHPNLIIRLSADDINKEPDYKFAEYIGVLTSSVDHEKGLPCNSYNNDGKCGSCRACWSTNIKEVSYKLH